MSFFNKKRLRIRIYGDPVLKKTAARIAEIDSELKALAKTMLTTMRSADGLGLAAPQVGISRRLVILDIPEPKSAVLSPGERLLLPKMPVPLVNPECVPVTTEQVTSEEGCLSVPKVYAKVTRPAKIMLTAEMINGERIHVECSGLLSKAIQHEIDHLNGVLFPDRIDDEEMGKIAPVLKKLLSENKKNR
ncbi:MAG: peptide deformylase [Victivallales bacterium]|nr:peptide deformylase [Victivallales bacterium]